MPEGLSSKVSIDGAYGEGGGQLVRTSVALSALTGRAVRIDNIRAGRSEPGLRAQHTAAVRAVADVCRAAVEGAEPGSRALAFQPTRPPQPGNYRWEIGTAGAVSLVFQAVLWPLALANGPSTLTLVGGTHVEWSPPLDYLQQVYLPALRNVVSTATGESPPASLAIDRWGWYPRGGGVVRAMVAGGVRLHSLQWTHRGSLRSVSVLSAVSNLPEHISQRQASRADFLLRKRGIQAQFQASAPPSPGRGTVVFVLAEYQNAQAGFTGYGRLGKPAEQVAEEACQAFVCYHEREQPIDEHLADQLLLPVALAHGWAEAHDDETQYAVESVTEHLLTQAWVIQQFLPAVRIQIDGDKGGTGLVTVHARHSFSGSN
jgi:RNA 3'-terminal phosphate cyclase (ATP)